MSLKIVITPEFSKLVKKLAKSYRKIYLDIETFKEELLENPKVGTDLGHKCMEVVNLCDVWFCRVTWSHLQLVTYCWSIHQHSKNSTPSLEPIIRKLLSLGMLLTLSNFK